MALERSEHLLALGVILAAIAAAGAGSVALLLGSLLVLISLYALSLRVSADYERSRYFRIVAAILLVSYGLAVSGMQGLFIAVSGVVIAYVAFRERTAYYAHIPVHRA